MPTNHLLPKHGRKRKATSWLLPSSECHHSTSDHLMTSKVRVCFCGGLALFWERLLEWYFQAYIHAMCASDIKATMNQKSKSYESALSWPPWADPSCLICFYGTYFLRDISYLNLCHSLMESLQLLPQCKLQKLHKGRY